PITVREPGRLIGTHVFTGMERTPDGAALRWSVTSVPTEPAARTEKPATYAARDQTTQTASAALDRLVIPADVAERISDLLSPGASLIISDLGLGETGSGTEFVVLTR